MRDVSGWLNEISGCLAGSSETAVLDAQVLLAHCLGRPLSWVVAHPEVVPEPAQEARISAAISQLDRGLPLPYVLGEWEFFGLKFRVTPDVLIPRPETELLVEQALNWLEAYPAHQPVLDVGTGSGCIAIALAVHWPALRLVATDRSRQALRLARHNAQEHGVDRRIDFVQADLLQPFRAISAGPAALILANLPYIPTASLHTLDVYRREPVLALDGGADGLELIRGLLEQAGQIFRRGGARPAMLLLEIEASQGGPVRQVAGEVFPTAEIQVLPDLAGHDRLLKVLVPKI